MHRTHEKSEEFLCSACTFVVVPRLESGRSHLSSHMEAHRTMASSVVVLLFEVVRSVVERIVVERTVVERTVVERTVVCRS